MGDRKRRQEREGRSWERKARDGKRFEVVDGIRRGGRGIGVGVMTLAVVMMTSVVLVMTAVVLVMTEMVVVMRLGKTVVVVVMVAIIAILLLRSFLPVGRMPMFSIYA